MSSNEAYSTAEQRILLTLASAAIEHGLATAQKPKLELSAYSAKLKQVRASFVTLQLDDDLRGCIGSLEATKPLINDINEHAYAAAFADPRFSPLSREEFKRLHLSISILTPPEPMIFSSEQDLLAQIRPGVDGLILTEGDQRSTFLPSVWKSLADKKDFLMHLKRKAGLPNNYWSESIYIERYTTFSF